MFYCQFYHQGEWYFLAVMMDGHGGVEACDFFAMWFLPCFSAENGSSMKEKLTATFRLLDHEFLQNLSCIYVGTTVAALLYEYKSKCYWSVHAGDSRILIGDATLESSLIFATCDHRRDNLKEQKRFTEEEKKSWIELPMTRVFGDQAWKTKWPSLTASPGN
jgi:serine/threonine protein phosphatase PrpC